MSQSDEARQLRRRYDDLENNADQQNQGPSAGSPCLLVQTAVEHTYPTSPDVFFYCQVLSMLGSEAEGQAPAVSTDTGNTLYALNLGTQIPPVGTQLLVSFVPSRWVFRYDG